MILPVVDPCAPILREAMSSSLLEASETVTSASRSRRLRAAKSKQRLWEEKAMLVNAWLPVPMIPPPWWQPECEIPPDGSIEETASHAPPNQFGDYSLSPDAFSASPEISEELGCHDDSCADTMRTIADSLSDLNDQLCQWLYHSSSRTEEVHDDDSFCCDGYCWLSEELPSHYDECNVDRIIIDTAKELLSKAVVVDTQLTTEGDGLGEQTYEEWQSSLESVSLQGASFDSHSGLLIEAAVDFHEGPSTSLLLLVRARSTEDASDVADACVCHLKARLPKLPVPLQYDWLFFNVVGDPTAKALESKCHVRLLVFVRDPREQDDSDIDET